MAEGEGGLMAEGEGGLIALAVLAVIGTGKELFKGLGEVAHQLGPGYDTSPNTINGVTFRSGPAETAQLGPGLIYTPTTRQGVADWLRGAQPQAGGMPVAAPFWSQVEAGVLAPFGLYSGNAWAPAIWEAQPSVVDWSQVGALYPGFTLPGQGGFDVLALSGPSIAV